MSLDGGSLGSKNAASVSTLGVDRVGGPETAGDPEVDDPLVALRSTGQPLIRRRGGLSCKWKGPRRSFQIRRLFK